MPTTAMPVAGKEQFPTFRRIRRRLARAARPVGKVLLVLVLLLAVLHGGATWLLGWHVEAEVARLKAAGAPVSAGDLAGAPIPASENAAVVYARALSLIDTEQAKKDDNLLARYLKLPERTKDPGLRAAVEQTVARYSAVFPLARDAARRPQCRFPVQYGSFFSTLYPHLATMRRLARLLCVKAVLEARAGRMPEAVETLATAFGQAHSLRDDPSLISQLVAVAIVRTSSAALREVTAWGDLSEAQTRQLDEVLAGMEMTSGFDRAMQGERTSGVMFFDGIRRGDPSVGGLFPDEEGLSALVHHVLPSYAWRPLLYADELAYLTTMSEQMRLAHLPWRELHDSRVAEDRYIQELPATALASRMVVPVFSRIARTRDLAETELAGSRVLLALLAYRSRFGAYPETLSALHARLGCDVPADPLSGRAFVYRRAGRGFLFYSVGDDLKDDGGRLSPERSGRLGEGLVLHGRPDPDTGMAVGAVPLATRVPAGSVPPSDIVWQRER